MRGQRQLALVLAIRNERGLDQHRWDIGRLEHHEPRLLHARLADFADAVERLQHVLRRHHARGDARGLRQIEQHVGEHGVLVIELDAALQVGRVFALGQPARGLARSAAIRQHVHRRTRHVGIGDGIGVDRHEQVRLGAPGSRVPLAQADEVVAVAREHRLHAGLRVDARRQRLGDRQHRVFLVRAAFAGSAGIHAAMTGIDRDHDVAAGIARRMRGANGHGRRGNHRRHGHHLRCSRAAALPAMSRMRR